MKVFEKGDRVEIRQTSVPSYATAPRGTIITADDEFDECWLVAVDGTNQFLPLPASDLRKLSLLELIAEAAR